MSSSAVLTGVRRLRFLLAGQHGREQSDEQLLTAFTDHRDESAFAALVHRHGPMVLGVCRRILGHEQDAEDALQAVFLVLARRAASLRNKSALPSFLHGTAYHLASKAKRAAGRRRKHEGSLGTLTQPRPSADPPDALLWREVRAALDEEIARLPEKYRSVFVLCCLEELSQAEAGRRLGLKEGTTANRLAQARKLLAQRLARRGVELTAALAASLLAVPPASALPAELTATTIKAALAAAAGKQWAGIVSASVAKLVHGAPATMLVSKAKMAAAVLLLVVTSSSLVGWFGRASGPLAGTTEPPAAKVDDKPRAVPPKREAAKTVAVQGRVFGPDGKPKQGAELLLLSADGEIKPLGATAADGCFTVSIPKAMPLPWLIAQTQNTGIDFLHVDQLKLGKSVELRLVKDQPIRGRVVNTEGKPIRGARVTVRGISVYPNELLDSFRADWKKGHFQREFPNSKKRLWSKTAALLPTRTDADGRFALHGIGEDWLVRLRIRGVGIADTEWSIVNDNYFDPKPSKPVSTLAITGNDMVLVESREARHGPKVAIVASAEKPIRGVVKDADTGKGRPGVEVLLNRIEPENGKGRFLVGPLVKARTDERGRYELHGVRKGKSYLLEVLSDTAAGYLRCQVIVADTPGHQPITADIPVKKGVIVTGTLREKATGKPIPGWVRIDFLSNNPFVNDYPKYNSSAWYDRPITNEDGVFRVVAVPGPVLLIGGPDQERLADKPAGHLKYKPATPDPDYPQYFSKKDQPTGYLYYSYGSGSRPLQGNFCKVLQIKPGVAVVKQDVLLETGSILPVRIRDAEGQPLAKTWVSGMSPEGWEWPIACPADSCAAYNLEPGQQRLMVFFEPTKKLMGSRTLKGGDKKPVVVKLAPAGAIKGQLLDADGKLLVGVGIAVSYRDPEAEAMERIIHEDKQVVTDARGAFTIDELIPGLKFELAFYHSKRGFLREAKPAQAMNPLQAGESRDVGAIKLK